MTKVRDDLCEEQQLSHWFQRRESAHEVHLEIIQATDWSRDSNPLPLY